MNANEVSKPEPLPDENSSPHQSFADGAVPDFKSSVSQPSKQGSRVSSKGNSRTNKSVGAAKAVSENNQSEKSFDRNKFALRLKKDSMASNFDQKQPKYVSVSKYTYKGNSTGNFKVVGKGLFVIPPQLKLTIITIIVTVGPAIFQIAYNNRNFK